MLDSLESGKITTKSVLNNLPERQPPNYDLKRIKLERIFQNGSPDVSNLEELEISDGYKIYLSRFTDQPSFLSPEVAASLSNNLVLRSKNILSTHSSFNFLLDEIFELKLASTGQQLSLPVEKSFVDAALTRLGENYENIYTQLQSYLIPLLSIGEKSALTIFTPDRKEKLKYEYNEWVERYEERKDSDLFDYILRIASLYRLAFPQDKQLLTPQDQLFSTIVEDYDPEENVIHTEESFFGMMVIAAQHVLLDETGVHLSFDKKPLLAKNNPRPMERKF